MIIDSINHLVSALDEALSLWALTKAAGLTLALTALSMPLALLAGLVLASMRLSRRRWLVWPAAAYIETIRGTPLVVQIFLIYYTLPQAGQWLSKETGGWFSPEWLTWNNFAVGVFCLAANYAAYEAEILRAGLEAVDKGQREGGLSLGMSEGQAFGAIVLPQAFRIVVPPVINDLIAMLKDSCLVYVIGVQELLTVAIGIGRARFITPQMMVEAAAVYLVLSLACYALGKFLEKRLSIRGAAELHLEQPHGH
ncbi:MAG: amino acid ABC transporter permease [Phycisphaerae bacterium]